MIKNFIKVLFALLIATPVFSADLGGRILDIGSDTTYPPHESIDPNTGEVAAPDQKLEKLAKIASSKIIIPTKMTFVDIAGLVKGASRGEGLGNKFLANIRECDAIIQVLRCFKDDNITHVSGKIDPVNDAEIIETELLLSDIESIEKKIFSLKKKANSGDGIAKKEQQILENILMLYQNQKPMT